jgi:large subunit ribosomal protein L4
MKIDVVNTQGKAIEQIELDDAIYTGTINKDVLNQVINGYVANARSFRKASTKTRGDVSGSGAKPWRQKGSGRARVGEKRNPLWKKGGIVFGPHPRKTLKTIPQKMKVTALKHALRSKVQDSELVVLDTLTVGSHKTKEITSILNNLSLGGKKVTFVAGAFDKEVQLSARNLQRVELIQATDLNAYTALNCTKLVVTREGLQAVEKRITGK